MLDKEIEVGLGSLGKIKIIRILSLNPEKTFTRYGLKKSTGLKDRDLKKHLTELVDLDWIIKFNSTPETYAINKKNEVASLLIQFFQELELLKKKETS